MPNSDDEDLARKLHTSIEANDIEGVRNALDHGAIPINFNYLTDGFMHRTIGTAIYSCSSIDLMKLLIEKGAKIVGEKDDLYHDDLSFSLNSSLLAIHQNIRKISPQSIQHHTQFHIVQFLLNNGAVVVNDLSTLKQEIIDIIQKCKQGQFNDLNEDLNYLCNTKNDYNNKYYDKILLKVNQSGIKIHLVELVKMLINNTQKPIDITIYTDVVKNQVVGLYVAKQAETGGYYTQEYYTTLYKVFNSKHSIDQVARIAKLVVDYDSNSITSNQIQAITTSYSGELEIITNLNPPMEEYNFSTAYQVVQLIWKMLHKEYYGNKEEIASLIERVVQHGIKQEEMEKAVDQVCDLWQGLYADVRNFKGNDVPSENQLLTTRSKVLNYIRECISKMQRTPVEDDETLHTLTTEAQLQDLNIAGPSRQ